MVDAPASLDSSTTPTDSVPTGAGDTVSIAASLIVLGEGYSNGRIRRALLKAGEDLASGVDIETVAGTLPPRFASLLQEGSRSGCLAELVSAERANDRNRQANGQLVASILSYHGLMAVLVTVFLVGYLTFSWTVLRRVVHEFHMFANGGSADDGNTRIFDFLLSAATVLSGLFALVVAGYFIASVVRRATNATGPPVWSWLLPNGSAIRQGDAVMEAFRFLAVYVANERPYPEATDAVQRIAHSSLTRCQSAVAHGLAVSGSNPAEAYSTKLIMQQRDVIAPTLALPLTSNGLSGTAALIAKMTEAEVERGARITRFVLTLVMAILLLLCFLIVAAPGLIHFLGIRSYFYL